jgi:hypothetical protein
MPHGRNKNMSTHRLTELLSPYRSFDATSPGELRAAIRRQTTRGPISRRIDQLVAARRASALVALLAELPAAA